MAWEPVVVPQSPACPVWAWYKPPQAPNDVVLQIPDEAYRTVPNGITLRELLNAADIPLREASAWTVHGLTFPVEGGANPLLDQPLPPAGPAGIVVHVQAPDLPLPRSEPLTSNSPQVHGTSEPLAASQAVLEAINAEWHAIIQHERQVDALRRQLGAVQGTLQSLNRDLDPDERLYADTLDKKDWQDTRRWLRDALALVGKTIRAHDIGATSAAGNRRRFEELYKQFVEPRIPFPGMELERLAFEQHRKNNQSLITHMQTAHAFAARDGVQRAQQVLSRIAAKVRTARAKR